MQKTVAILNVLDSRDSAVEVLLKMLERFMENLLLDEDGTIKPFAILGESNIAIEKEIAEKESLLGSEEEKTGLRYDLKKITDD